MKSEAHPVINYWGTPGTRYAFMDKLMHPKNITKEDVFTAIRQHFNVGDEFITSKVQKTKLSYIRQCSMYIFCTLSLKPLKEISKFYHGRYGKGMDHTTIISGRERIKKLMYGNQYIPATQTNAKDDIDALIGIIKKNKYGFLIKDIQKQHKNEHSNLISPAEQSPVIIPSLS